MSLAYHYSLYNPSDANVMKEVRGVLSIEGEEIMFEYKVYDMMGTAISTLNKFSFDVRYLKDIHVKKGLFKTKLIIQSTKMVFLDPLPGSSQGRIALDIKRQDKNEAFSFSSKLNLALSERRLKEMDE